MLQEKILVDLRFGNNILDNWQKWFTEEFMEWTSLQFKSLNCKRHCGENDLKSTDCEDTFEKVGFDKTGIQTQEKNKRFLKWGRRV